VVRLAHQHDAAIVANIRPFVCIGRDGIRLLDAFRQVAIPRRSGGSDTERAIHVYPRAGFSGTRTNFGNRIERSRVDIAGLHANYRARIQRRIQRRQSGGAHAALRIDGYAENTLPAEPGER